MYCGAKEVPAGKRRGTASECVKSNQIRYYGIEAINQLDIENGKNLSVAVKNLHSAEAKLQKLSMRTKAWRKGYEICKKLRAVTGRPEKLRNRDQVAYDKLMAERLILMVKITDAKKKIVDLTVIVDDLKIRRRTPIQKFNEVTDEYNKLAAQLRKLNKERNELKKPALKERKDILAAQQAKKNARRKV